MARSRRTWSTVGLLLLLIAVLAVALVYVLTARDLGTAVTVAGTLWTMGMGSATYVEWVVRRRKAAVATAEPALRKVAELLALSIDGQWRSAADERHLHATIPLSWRWSPHRVAGSPDDAIALPRGQRAPRRVPKAPIIRRPKLDEGKFQDLLDIYLGLPSGRILLLGKGGAGKTATAILLVIGALAQRATLDRASRALVPVPVMFSAQDWNPQAERVRPWLARRLTEDYGDAVGHDRDVAAELVSQGYVSVILDGLDEMPPPARVLALKELDEVADLRMVIVSRAEELEEIVDGAHLSGAAALELQPVGRHTAADYLRRRLPAPPSSAWNALLGALEQGGTPLARALDTPLMVSLLFDVYNPESDRHPDELLDTAKFPSREILESHLLSRLVPDAYSANRDSGQARPRYTEEQASRWLGYLATRLDRTRTGGADSLEWWKIPAWCPAWPRAVVTLVVVALALGVGFDIPDGLITGLTIALTRGPVSGLHDGLHIALTAGIPGTAGAANGVTNVLAALLIAWLGLRRTGQTPRRLGRLTWRNAISRWPVAFGICFGLLVGVGIGQDSANGNSAQGGGAGAIFNIGFGVAAGVAAMLVAALVNMLVARDQSPRASQVSPAGWWRSERWYGLAIGLLAGPATGVGVGFFLYRGIGYTTTGLVSMLVAIPVWTLMGAVMGLTYTQVWHTRLAAAQLFLRGRCPLNLMRFLQDATKRQVLRTAGGAYQFRHVAVQELLASAHGDGQGAGPGLARRLRAWLRPPPYAPD